MSHAFFSKQTDQIPDNLINKQNTSQTILLTQSLPLLMSHTISL